MNIPARYCTGYLGDIGIPPPYGPMDFAGWFEAYLGGQWHTFDPRNNIPRIGRILIARGRDATDVAISTTFDLSKLVLSKPIRTKLPRPVKHPYCSNSILDAGPWSDSPQRCATNRSFCWSLFNGAWTELTVTSTVIPRKSDAAPVQVPEKGPRRRWGCHRPWPRSGRREKMTTHEARD